MILIALMSFTQNLFSQDEKAIGRSLEIHVMPFALINSSPRFRFGIEYNVGSKLGYSLEIGAVKSFLNQGIVKNWSGGIDYSFFELRPEIKYYFYKAADNFSSFYGATELFFIHKKDVLEHDHYYPGSSDAIIHYDKANYKKVKYGINIKGGIKQLFFKRFDLDLYGGIGVACKKIDYSNVVNPFYSDGKENGEFLPHRDKYIGKSVNFNVTFGLKIGFILFQK